MLGLKKLVMGVGVVVIALLFINAVQTDSTENKENTTKDGETEAKEKVSNMYALDMPENLSFAGEEVPIEVPDVFERMDRELLVNTYWHSNTFLMIKRARKYFPIIEPILKKNGIPDDFKYLAVIESGLQNVVSPAKATGFWQIMAGTGRDYGLEINDNVDERYNLEKSTEVACKYIRDAKDRLGSWTMAAAAYNIGQAGIMKQLDRQKVENYYDTLLGEETGRYVFRILAMKEILIAPEKYGFNVEERHYYKEVPTYKVEVDTAITDMANFAKKFDINYKALKIYNPWLREAYLNNKSGKKYVLEIPRAGYYDHVE